MGSDTPWNGTQQTMAPESWTDGIPEFRRLSKDLVSSAGEPELTDMGLWTCVLNGGRGHNYDEYARNGFVKFAQMTPAHSDALVSAAHFTMCDKP